MRCGAISAELRRVVLSHLSKPLLDAIDGAKKSLRMKMFVFSDPGLIKAVIGARKRGVDVRVMLNAARRSGEAENEDTRKTLTAAGVTVLDSNPAFDLAPGSFDGHRELAIEADDAHVIKHLEKIAQHDWDHSVALDLADAGLTADLTKRGNGEGVADLVLDEDHHQHHKN